LNQEGILLPSGVFAPGYRKPIRTVAVPWGRCRCILGISCRFVRPNGDSQTQADRDGLGLHQMGLLAHPLGNTDAHVESLASTGISLTLLLDHNQCIQPTVFRKLHPVADADVIDEERTMFQGIARKVVLPCFGLLSSFWLIYGVGYSTKHWRHGVPYFFASLVSFWTCWFVYKKSGQDYSILLALLASLSTVYLAFAEFRLWRFEQNDQWCLVFSIVLALASIVLSLIGWSVIRQVVGKRNPPDHPIRYE